MKKKLLIVSLTAFFLVVNFVVVAAFQQRQTIKSQAAATTSLSFYPPSSFSNPIQASLNQPLQIELRMAPGNNKISRLQVHIVFPKNTFTIQGARFDVDTAVFPQIIEAPRVVEGANGDIFFTVANPAGIGYETKVGTLTLLPKKVVTEANQNDGVVGFLPVTSGVSIREGDSPTENAVVQLNQAYIHVSSQAVPGPVLTTPGAGGGGATTPVPTFMCLGSCPISPTVPVPNTGGGNPGGGNQSPATPTPCPDTQINSQNADDDIQATHRRGKKKGNSEGLLQILIKLLELLIQLLGGGTPAPADPGNGGGGGTPGDGGDTPGGGGDNPCPPVQNEPTDAPEPTEAPQATQAPAATQVPTAGPTTPASAAICGQKISGATAGSLPSCSGLTATQPTSSGLYGVTNFGCNIGFPKDPVDNCIPACSGTPECAGLSGRQCEEKVIWFSANADQYGCNAKLKVTNPKTGKAVIVRALDRGPGCAIQKSKGVFDISQAAYKEIGGDDGVVKVDKVPESTKLGPIPACTQ